MNAKKQEKRPNPMDKANFISKGLFCWLNPLFKKGYDRNLEPEDLFNVSPSDRSDHLGSRLEREWQKQLDGRKHGKQPSLFKALFHTFGVQYLLVGSVVFLEEVTKVVQPVLLGGLIRYFVPDSDVSRFEAWMYAMGVSLCAVMLAVSHHPYFFWVQRIGMRMRVACCSLMYKKCLRLSNKAMGETTTGQIVNLMSNDVNRFDQAVIFLHFLWIGPLQALLVLFILWRELGPSVLAGFFVLVLLIPLQGFMGKLFSKLRHKTAIHTDERVKVMNEIIAGMRVIKMYCWEKPFGQLVEKIRKGELSHTSRMRRLLSAQLSIHFFSGKAFMLALLTGLVSWAHAPTVTSHRVFLVMGTVHVCRVGFVIFFINAVTQSTQLAVVFARVEVSGEVHYLRRYHRVSSVRFFIYFTTDKVLTAALVSPYLYTRPCPRAAVVFTIILFSQAMHRVWGVYLFHLAESLSVCMVAARRVEKFLMLDELDSVSSSSSSSSSEGDDEKKNEAARPKPEDCYVTLSNVTGKWDEAMEQNTLDDISLEAKAGQLVSVIGPVGCGKSSLLMSILRELPTHKGQVNVSGRIAYVSQQPWIFSGTVRQNILFGADFEPAKYNKVVYAAALTRDFEIMPQGDSTLIGDRGVSLSGGQKARVSLARSLYMDADIYLMDDPLSAVDAAVARHIFERCIMRFLRNKPRILITHQVQFLPEADTIYILKEGKVTARGTFSELSQCGVDFSELLQEEEEDESAPTSPSMLAPAMQKGSSCDALPTAQVNKFGSMMSLGSMAEDYQPEPVNLPEQEERATGTVGMGIYVDYFKAGTGLFKFILLVVFNILAQIFYVGSDWWLSRWSNQEENRFAMRNEYYDFLQDHNMTAAQAYNNSLIDSNFTIPVIPYVDRDENISIFAGIILAVFIFGLGRALLFFKITVDASQTLHNRMFARILRSPVSFFDTNPVGRVLNRFSKDVGHMDDLLPVCFFDFMQCSLLILGIILVAGVINPYVFIPTIPLAVLFILVRMYYLRTSRSIKRLEGTLRSPVFSYLSASLQGLATIRSMGMEAKCIQEFDHFQDGHSEAWFLFLATSRWLAVRLDWLCVFFVTAVTFCAVLVSDTMSAGLAGLSITYSMTLMGMFQWGVRQSAEVENQMISVERVLEYSRLPEEAELESDKEKKPPTYWPLEGAIVAEDLCLQYSSNGPNVLKGLNFAIRGREKVGIVGRTGAGKSSLITALFRMAEPRGLITIDDINIQKIGLHDLRSNISIIPQDPFLFTGTLRKNLDPFLEHKDDALWRSLDEVKLKDQILDLPQGLSTEVSEGGTNFSVGQRQLICLARAVLRNNKVLLIDEATANVDPNTDELIQATIRSKFHECTVLTIAHRLHTIMDSDRVMVLDNGKIMEFDTPYTLLSQGEGHLYDMTQQTGKAEFDRLLEIAKEASLNRSTKELTDATPVTVPNGRAHSKEDTTLGDVTFISKSASTNSSTHELVPYELDDIVDNLDWPESVKDDNEEEDTEVNEEDEEKQDEVEPDDSSRSLMKSEVGYDVGENEALLSSSKGVGSNVDGRVDDSDEDMLPPRRIESSVDVNNDDDNEGGRQRLLSPKKVESSVDNYDSSENESEGGDKAPLPSKAVVPSSIVKKVESSVDVGGSSDDSDGGDNYRRDEKETLLSSKGVGSSVDDYSSSVDVVLIKGKQTSKKEGNGVDVEDVGDGADDTNQFDENESLLQPKSDSYNVTKKRKDDDDDEDAISV